MLELQSRDREFSPSGGSRGGAHPAPPLFLEQTKAQKAEIFFFRDRPRYLRVWMTAPPPPPLSKGLNLPLNPQLNR